MVKKIIYSDFDLRFIANPITKKLSILTNEESVKQSIKNIVLSNYYDWFYRPYKAANVTSHLFENYGAFTELDIKDDVERVIKSYENRVKNLRVNVISSPSNKGFSVTISFNIINIVNDIKLELFLKRVR